MEMITNKELAEKVIDYQNKTRKDFDNARQAEKQEKIFWKGAGLINVNSTFSGIAYSGFNPLIMQCMDTKKELQLFGDLISTYKIGKVDAIHLMHAHSANLDYFLTWDKTLIKKAKNVKWLDCSVCTPKKFLEKFS